MKLALMQLNLKTAVSISVFNGINYNRMINKKIFTKIKLIL